MFESDYYTHFGGNSYPQVGGMFQSDDKITKKCKKDKNYNDNIKYCKRYSRKTDQNRCIAGQNTVLQHCKDLEEVLQSANKSDTESDKKSKQKSNQKSDKGWFGKKKTNPPPDIIIQDNTENDSTTSSKNLTRFTGMFKKGSTGQPDIDSLIDQINNAETQITELNINQSTSYDPSIDELVAIRKRIEKQLNSLKKNQEYSSNKHLQEIHQKIQQPITHQDYKSLEYQINEQARKQKG